MLGPIQSQLPHEEFDYQTLLDILKDYSRPRDKISDLIRKEVIIRIKKGLYVLGEGYRRRPYSRELLANLIYGPSYISLESALQHYGLIPEHVEALTSVTTGRSRKFNTPVGLFIYRQTPLQAFRIGMTRVEMEDRPAFLIATPEKALSDKIREDRGTGIQSRQQMYAYVVENLRIDVMSLERLRPEAVLQIARGYRSRKIRLLADLIRWLRSRNNGGKNE